MGRRGGSAARLCRGAPLARCDRGDRGSTPPRVPRQAERLGTRSPGGTPSTVNNPPRPAALTIRLRSHRRPTTTRRPPARGRTRLPSRHDLHPRGQPQERGPAPCTSPTSSQRPGCSAAAWAADSSSSTATPTSGQTGTHTSCAGHTTPAPPSTAAPAPRRTGEPGHLGGERPHGPSGTRLPRSRGDETRTCDRPAPSRRTARHDTCRSVPAVPIVPVPGARTRGAAVRRAPGARGLGGSGVVDGGAARRYVGATRQLLPLQRESLRIAATRSAFLRANAGSAARFFSSWRSARRS